MVIERLMADLAAARTAGKVPDINEYGEPRKGEEVVFAITNPDLLAFVGLVDEGRKKARAMEEPLSIEAQAELLVVQATEELLWYELRQNLVAVDAEGFGLRRRGNELVVIKADRPPMPRIISISLGGIPGIDLSELLGAASARDCEHTDCPLHGQCQGN